MLNPIITPPRVPLVDPNTGLISRAWYLFFLSLNNVSNDVVDNPVVGPSTESLIASYDAILQTLTQEVQTQPTQEGALDQIAELQKQTEALALAPPVVVAGQALTEVDDTNVTMTLSGNPTAALLEPVLMTLGWTGTLAVSRGGSGASTAATARTNFGATTVGSNLFTLTNPSAVTYMRINADNSVSTLDAATFRTAIGAGTGNGTVTSVATGTGLTGGPITGSGTISFSTAAVGTWAATPSSANLAAAMTDETGSGSLVFATRPSFANTIGVGGAAAAASGAGITFPATVSLSTDPNTLDDYEEGSWTPSITGLTLGNASGVAFNYVRVGNIVTVTLGFIWGSTTSSSGVWEFSVPFGASTGGGGTAYLLDSGSAEYMVNAGIATISFAGVRVGTNTTGFVSNVTPFIWAVNDRFSCAVTYRI